MALRGSDGGYWLAGGFARPFEVFARRIYIIQNVEFHMTISRNPLIAILAVAVALVGYFYYQSRQNVIEIKVPRVKLEKQ